MDFRELLNETTDTSKLKTGTKLVVIKKSPFLDRLALVFYPNGKYNIRPGFTFEITGKENGLYTVKTSDSDNKQYLSKQDIDDLIKRKQIKL
jgi:hypothetical protein